jgi:peptidoglycan hydrolase CwlO-like protein
MHLLPQVVQEKESRITADGEAMRGIEARIQDKDTAYRTALTDIQQLKEDLKESQRELTKYMNRVQQLDGAVHSKNDIMRKQVRHPSCGRPCVMPARADCSSLV